MTPQDIKAARARQGLTQEQLARKLGVSWSTVARWECGLSRPSPRMASYRKLLRLLEEAQGK